MCVRRSECSHRLVCEWRQNNGFLHGVHHQLPQLLQHTLQHSLLTDLGKQSQAGRRGRQKEGKEEQMNNMQQKDANAAFLKKRTDEKEGEAVK